MMYIKKIFKCYEDYPEADVLVSDGEFELLCYALFYDNKEGDTNFTLSAMMDGDNSLFANASVMTSEEKGYKVQKLDDGYFSYKLQGKLIDIEKENGTVQIGSLIIHDVAPIPRDIKVGEFVEFKVMRIDLETVK